MKCGEASKAGSGPPSRDNEHWILVSLVMREREAVRSLGCSMEPIVLVEGIKMLDGMGVEKVIYLLRPA